jgi:plastocyanin
MVAALALVALAGAGGAATTAAAECSWQRHSKRVVKHVRRQGRVRKVVRRKTWWSCDPSTAPAAAPGATSPPPSTTPPSDVPPFQPAPEPEADRLAVKAHEYYYVLSRAKVQAGEVTVELNNQGEDPHNLNIQREGDEGEPLQVAETDSLQHNVATFDLAPGTYRLWCALPEHDEKGMHATLVVE